MANLVYRPNHNMELRNMSILRPKIFSHLNLCSVSLNPFRKIK